MSTELNNYVPVTKSQETEITISQSVKIGKQVMKKALQSGLKDLQAKRDSISIIIRTSSDSIDKTLCSWVQARIEQYISKDKELSRFRNMFNRFSMFDQEEGEYGKLKHNLDIIRDISMINSNYSARYYHKTLLDNLIQSPELIIKDGDSRCITIDVESCFPDRMTDNSNGDDYLTWSYEVPLKGEHLEAIAQHKLLLEEQLKLLLQHHELEKKLENIDAVAEEMEASLLVAELRKTTQGVEALAIATNLVSEMLGEMPSLLAPVGEK